MANPVSAVVPYGRPVPSPEAPPPAVAAPAPASVVPAPAAPEVPTAPAAPEVPVAPEVPEAPEVDEASYAELMAPYTQELNETGTLSNESIQNLATQFKVPTEIIEYTYKGMLQAQHERDQSILAVCDGLEGYQEMVRWAGVGGGYTEEEVDSFNEAITRGSSAEALEHVRALKQRFTEVNGSARAKVAQATQRTTAAPLPATPSAAPVVPQAPAVQPFGSFSELVEAQRDPRYAKERAYTDSVIARLQASPHIYRK